MMPTGHYDRRAGDLVLERRFTAPIHDVWDSITVSERLARWFGTWTGDPRSGSVMVTMTAEAEAIPPIRYAIDACEPPHRLAVSATDDSGTWRLDAQLSEDGDGTLLVRRQRGIDESSLAETGPGWEWYLDRLVAAVVGSEPPDLAAFDVDYMPMSAGYAAMAAERS
jgi:uncharacterized protein YndB with AHSA1/START domain